MSDKPHLVVHLSFIPPGWMKYSLSLFGPLGEVTSGVG